MILKLIPLSLLQSVLLSTGQVLLKYTLTNVPQFGWTKAFWLALFTKWQFLAGGICFLSASLLWIYILKLFPLGIAYQMTSLCYVITLLFSVLFFHESSNIYQWIGCLLIVGGCALILKS